MLRLTLLSVLVTMLAAGAASGNPAKQSAWRGHIHKAKEFLLGNQGIPSALHKALLGTVAAGVIWGQALAPACASDCLQDIAQERGSDTALQQVTQETPKKGDTKPSEQGKLTTLLHAQNELYDVLLKLHAMKTYDPDFATTVADGKAKLEKMLQAEQDRGSATLVTRRRIELGVQI